MNKRRVYCTPVATVILVGFSRLVYANLIVNGNFEEPVIAPETITFEDPGVTTGNWTQLPDGLDRNGDFYAGGHILGTDWQAAAGNQSRHLGANNEAGGVYQDFTTQIGEQYLLTFSSSGFPTVGADQTGYVSVGPASDPTAYLDTPYVTPEGASFSDMGWTVQQFTFTATASTSRLTFETPGPFGPVGAITIDDVQVDVLVGLPLLTVDRETGALTLSNSLAPLQVVEYSITSSGGALDPSHWTSVAGNYDVPPSGDGSFDPDDSWSIDSATHFALTESQSGPTGDGGSLGGSPLVLSQGGGWIQSLDESLQMELVLFGGSQMSVPVEFVGNGDVPFERSDLNFDGLIDANDWPTFRDNNLTDLSGLTPAQAYGRGDLDRDGDNDLADFRTFKADFETVNGVGSFARMLAGIPEPSSVLLLSLGGLLLLRKRVRGRMLSGCLAALAVTGIMASPACLANLIINGGFEDGSPVNGTDPLGWAEDFNSFGSFDGGARTGAWGLHAGADGASGGQYQDISTDIGTTYDVSLWFRNFIGLSPFDGHVRVLVGEPGFDSVPVDDAGNNSNLFRSANLVDHLQATATDGSWSEAAFQFTATASATRFGIYLASLTGDNASIDVDDVFVTESRSILATVDTVTGSVTFENNGSNPIGGFDYYQIDSPAGALDPDGWTSLHDQNFQPTGTGVGQTWDESGGSDAFRLAELFLDGSSTLAVGESVSLGRAFNPSVWGPGTDGDLTFFLSFVDGARLPGTVQYVASAAPGDFNRDGTWDCADINALTAAVASQSTDLAFDMNGDGVVNLADITDAGDGWLAVGGANNAAVTGGNAFLSGDANLDGAVDVSDFNAWNSNKFTDLPEWCSGDFNADGSVDVSDFNIWNGRKFTSSADVSALPEPAAWSLGLLALIAACGLRRT